MVVCGILYSYRETELKLSQGSLNDKKISYLVSYFSYLALAYSFPNFCLPVSSVQLLDFTSRHFCYLITTSYTLASATVGIMF